MSSASGFTYRVTDHTSRIAGAKPVWVIDPQRSAVHVCRADGSLAVLGERDSLDGEDVLPGFSCAVMDVLA